MHLEVSAAAFLAQKLAAIDADVPSLVLRVTGQSDPEAIHDLRVAIRRLRTLLRLARPIYGRHHTDAIRAIYTRVARASGALRDEEVYLELLEKYGSELVGPAHDAFTELVAARRARESELRAAVQKSLATDDVTRARTMLGALLALPIRPKRDRELARFGRRAVLRALSAVDEHRDATEDDVEALHDLRIAYKGLRYTLEFFAPVLPPDLLAMHDSAVRFQKRLGDIHDLDMARVLIDELEHAHGPGALRDALAVAFADARQKKFLAFAGEMRPQRHAVEPSGGPHSA